jgi:hypothetical protein
VARPSIPAKSRQAFIDALAVGATVDEACARSFIGRSTVYRHRDEDPQFRAAWDDARERAVDVLEGELYVRARDRSDPQSASLLKFALSGYRRQTFGQRVEVNATVQAVPADEAKRLQALAAAHPELTVGELVRQLEAGSNGSGS